MQGLTSPQCGRCQATSTGSTIFPLAPMRLTGYGSQLGKRESPVGLGKLINPINLKMRERIANPNNDSCLSSIMLCFSQLAKRMFVLPYMSEKS